MIGFQVFIHRIVKLHTRIPLHDYQSSLQKMSLSFQLQQGLFAILAQPRNRSNVISMSLPPCPYSVMCSIALEVSDPTEGNVLCLLSVLNSFLPRGRFLFVFLPQQELLTDIGRVRKYSSKVPTGRKQVLFLRLRRNAETLCVHSSYKAPSRIDGRIDVTSVSASGFFWKL